MKKREQGVLTVEASIVLTFSLMFILFLFGFARMYRAQNVMAHAVMQSADVLALESYTREVAFNEDVSSIVQLGSQLSGSTVLNAESFTSLRTADLPKIARQRFIAALAPTEEQADQILKRLGVKDGLAGVDFSASTMDLEHNDVIVHSNYALKLQFPVMGFDSISVSKAAKAKTFGDILFEICTIPNDERKGSASGGGNYTYGSEIEIVAKPNYGYYFDGWDDNGDGTVDYDVSDTIAESRRTVTVTDAKTYTAIFKNNGYAINYKVVPEGVATIAVAPAPGANGLHTYGSSATVTIQNADSHYTWSGWSGSVMQDLDGDGYEEVVKPISGVKTNATYSIPSVDGVYHLTANFKAKVYDVSLKVKNNGGSVHFANSTDTFRNVTYPGKVTVVAEPAEGYEVDYWEMNGVRLENSNGRKTLDQVAITKNTELTVVYKSTYVQVRFHGPNQEVLSTVTLVAGKSFQSCGKSLPYCEGINGKALDGWIDFTQNTVVWSNLDVKGNWVTPKITLTASDAGIHSMTFEVKTTPANLSVHWSCSKTNGYAFEVNGKSAKITLVDEALKKVKFKDNYITIGTNQSDDGKTNTKARDYYTEVEVTASLVIDNNKAETIKLTVKPSVHLEHWSYKKGSQRQYHKTKQSNAYTKGKTGLNYSDVYGCYNKWTQITYSVYKAKGKFYQKDSRFEGSSDGYQTGMVRDQADGLGAVGHEAQVGNKYFELYYPTFYGEKKSNGDYYDYYISAKQNV